MSDELEARLRRTYRAAADRTVVATPDRLSGVPANALPVRHRLPRRPVMAAAAVVTIVLGGLYVLAGREATAPAASEVFTSVVPGFLPSEVGAGEDRSLALRSISPPGAIPRLEYANDNATLTITVQPEIAVEMTGAPVSLPLGTGLLSVDGDTARLLVAFGDEFVAEILMAGTFANPSNDAHAAVTVGRHLLPITGDEWALASSTGGFVAEEELSTHEAAGATVNIVGDLHEGFWLRLSHLEVRPGHDHDRQTCFTNRLPDGIIVVAPAGATRVRLLLDEGPSDVAVESFRGSLSIAMVDLATRPVAQPDCEVLP